MTLVWDTDGPCSFCLNKRYPRLAIENAEICEECIRAALDALPDDGESVGHERAEGDGA